jgi:hypothetical protein
MKTVNAHTHRIPLVIARDPAVRNGIGGWVGGNGSGKRSWTHRRKGTIEKAAHDENNEHTMRKRIG